MTYRANLGLWQRLKLRLLGHVFLRLEKRPGWRSALPIFLVKCGRHGFFEDYPHGYRSYFSCPECESEWKNRKVEKVVQ